MLIYYQTKFCLKGTTMKLFMDKANYNKLNLFKSLLLSKNPIELNQLITDHKHSKSTLFRYLKDLEKDLNKTFPEGGVVITSASPGYIVEITNGLSKNYVIDKLRLTYLKTSINFKIMEALLQNKFSTTEELANKLYLSSSYLYKHLKEIKIILSEFNIGINFRASSSHNSNLECSELQLRFFMVYIFWSLFKGIEWPFEKIPKDIFDYYEQDNIFSDIKESSKKERLRYLVAISFWRSNKKNEFVSLEDDLVKIIEVFTVYKDISRPFIRSINGYNSSVYQQEILSFNFLARMVMGNIDNDNNRLNISKGLLQLEVPIIKYCSNLLDAIIEDFDLVMRDEEKLLNFYYIVLCHLYTYYIGVSDKKYLNHSMDIDHIKIHKNYEFNSKNEDIKNFYKRYVSSCSLKEFIPNKKFSLLLESLVYFIIDNNKKKKIKIFVNFSRIIAGEDFIKHKILDMFGTDNITFTLNILNADIIISDCYEGNVPQNNCFYIEELYDLGIWKNLFDFIQKYLFFRTFSL